MISMSYSIKKHSQKRIIYHGKSIYNIYNNKYDMIQIPKNY